jgi:hypothetical protein
MYAMQGGIVLIGGERMSLILLKNKVMLSVYSVVLKMAKEG